jgi:hypothetical protein
MRDRALGLLGMRELDRGLHLRPDNLAGGVAAARERLFKLGLEPATAVFVARDLDDARELRARALWDGAALNRGYRETRRRLEDWLARADALEPEVAHENLSCWATTPSASWCSTPCCPHPGWTPTRATVSSTPSCASTPPASPSGNDSERRPRHERPRTPAQGRPVPRRHP